MDVPAWQYQKIVDEDGMPTESFQVFIESLVSEMQRTVSDTGFVNPSQSTDNIETIFAETNPERARSDGTILYDKDLQELKVKINGVTRVIQLV